MGFLEDVKERLNALRKRMIRVAQRRIKKKISFFCLFKDLLGIKKQYILKLSMEQNDTKETDNAKIKKLEEDLVEIGKKVKEEPVETQQPPKEASTPVLTQTSGKSKSVVYIALGLLLVSLIGLGAYYLGSQKTAKVAPTPTSTPISIAPTSTPDPTEGWVPYTSGLTGISFKHPADLEVKDVQGGININKWGPTQTAATELFDGWSLSFYKYATASSSLEYVNEKIAQIPDAQGDIELLSGPTQTTLGAYAAYTYTTRSLGDSTSIVLNMPTGDYILEAVYIVADPGSLNFQDVVDLILSTFEFI